MEEVAVSAPKVPVGDERTDEKRIEEVAFASIVLPVTLRLALVRPPLKLRLVDVASPGKR